MQKCEICGKPTTSHKLKNCYVCHTCWTERKEDVKELKERAREEERSKKRLRESGKEISKKIEKVDTKEKVYSVMDLYQERLNRSMGLDKSGDLFRKISDEAREDMCELLHEFAEEEGWPFVLELIDKYGFENDKVIDNVPIENVVERMIISTRTEKGVKDIPVEALEYLAKFYDAVDVEWEDSFALGWGFDHPDFDLDGVLEKAIEEDQAIWASAVLERAIYADQEKASSILIDMLRRDDLSQSVKMRLVQSVTFFTGKEWERPDMLLRYWDWKEAVGNGRFKWDEVVKESLKKVIEEELAGYIEKEQNNIETFFDRTRKALPAKDVDFSEEWSLTDLQN
ncbi:MAG: hypothetical protein ACOCZJ_03015 [Thermoplasmatota archaeon]